MSYAYCPIGETYLALGSNSSLGARAFTSNDILPTRFATFEANGSVSFRPTSFIPGEMELGFINPETSSQIWNYTKLKSLISEYTLSSTKTLSLTRFYVNSISAFYVWILDGHASIKCGPPIVEGNVEYDLLSPISVKVDIDFTTAPILTLVASFKQGTKGETLKASGNIVATTGKIGITSGTGNPTINVSTLYVVGQDLEDNCIEAEATWQNGYNGPSVDFFTDPRRALNELEATFEVTSEFIQQYQDSSTDGDEVISVY